MRMGYLSALGLAVLVGVGSVGARAADSAAVDAGVIAWAGSQYAAAVRLWQPLARTGNAQAQRYLGYAYRRGLGVPRDDARAAYWYRRAAVQGQADAQYALGLMYELGVGLAPDMAEADYWYGLAIAQGTSEKIQRFRGTGRCRQNRSR